jgi:ATP-dependent Clp protease adaptor protein ClpS
MTYTNHGHSEETDIDIQLESIDTEDYELVLYNDDVNTFDHVINCLVKYCKHDIYQAEQCAWIVHSKGKCSVKSGQYTLLEPLCTALCDQGLSAQVELV